MTNLLNTFTELQAKTMETVLEHAKNMPNSLVAMFGTPLDSFKTTLMNTNNAQSMYENNKKFNTAYANYHRAIADMITATNNNIELFKKDTVKSN